MGSVVPTLPEGQSHEAPGKVAERGSNLIQRRWQVGGQEGDSGEYFCFPGKEVAGRSDESVKHPEV